MHVGFHGEGNHSRFFSIMYSEKGSSLFWGGTACIEGISKIGLMPPITRIRWTSLPQVGRPRSGSSAVFMIVIRKRLPCPARYREATGRPHRGDTSRTKFNNTANYTKWRWTVKIAIWDCTLAGPFSFFYIKTKAHYKEVRSQRKYYHDQRTNLNLTRMIRFSFLRVSCWGNSCRLKNYRVCLTTSLYSLLIFFVFLL